MDELEQDEPTVLNEIDGPPALMVEFSSDSDSDSQNDEEVINDSL